MRDHAIDGTVSFLDLWALFPRWINRHRKGREERCYSAKAISRVSADGLALAVEMSGSDGLITTYKCNIHEVRSRRKSWIVLSLLVVLWEQGRSERGSEAGEAMIRHLTSAVQDFGRSRGMRSHGILIASGNLTAIKGGKPFFERLGWDIVFPEARQPDHLYSGGDAIAEPLTAINVEIQAAIAPLLEIGAIGPEPVSFALLRVA